MFVKSRAIKIIVLAICLVLVMSLFVGCVNGCPGQNTEQPDRYEDKNIGDFVVRFYTDEDYCEIKGTTEQGNEKRFLVIPAYIDGVRVDSLGVYQPFMADPAKLLRPEIESDTIEKVYFESAVKVSSASFDYYFSCPNLKKVMYYGVEVYPYFMNKGQIIVYYPRGMYENNKNNDPTFESMYRTLPANVSYCYNYDDSENSGYYWIDDCDYGEKIEFIPKDPVREGYTFDGWYKEADCENKWNFDTDTLPEEVTEIDEDGNESVKHQETVLYAKWI